MAALAAIGFLLFFVGLVFVIALAFVNRDSVGFASSACLVVGVVLYAVGMLVPQILG